VHGKAKNVTKTKDEAPCACKSHAKDATLADEIKQVEREILRLEMNPDNVEGGAKAFHSGNRTTLKPAAQRKLDQLNKKLDDLLDKASGTQDAETIPKIVPGESSSSNGSTKRVWNVQAPDGYVYETFSRRVDAEYWLNQFKRKQQESKDSAAETKDATLVNSDKGKIVRLFTGVTGKVLEVDENKKRAYVEVQSAREGSYKMWVDFSEVES